MFDSDEQDKRLEFVKKTDIKHCINGGKHSYVFRDGFLSTENNNLVIQKR